MASEKDTKDAAALVMAGGQLSLGLLP